MNNNSDFVPEKISQTVQISEISAQASDLDDDIVELRKKLRVTKIQTIAIWVLCVLAFLSKFYL